MFNNRRGYFGLIALLLVMAVIAFLSFKALNVYLNRSTSVDTRNREIISESGVSGPSYNKILDGVSKKVEDLNRQTVDLQNKVEDLTK